MVDRETESLVRSYYEAIDAGEYDALAELLAPSFEQVRPDRTLTGRATFVSFMRDDRPRTDTNHEIASVLVDGDRAAVRGRLVTDDGTELFAFADHVLVDDGRLRRLETYTR